MTKCITVPKAQTHHMLIQTGRDGGWEGDSDQTRHKESSKGEGRGLVWRHLKPSLAGDGAKL